MGLIAMSERDLQRIEILSKVTAGRMTVMSASHVLDLSTRQVRRLSERIRTDGTASIRHSSGGRFIGCGCDARPPRSLLYPVHPEMARLPNQLSSKRGEVSHRLRRGRSKRQ